MSGKVMVMRMDSKQRVRAVLEGKMPDRTPLGFYAIDSDTAARILGRPTYWRAKAKCRIAFWEGRRDEVVQSWIVDGIELYKKLDMIDIIPVCCPAAGIAPPQDYDPDPPRQIDENTWIDRHDCVHRYSPVTQDITMVSDPNMWTRQYRVETERWDGQVHSPDKTIFEAVDALIDCFKDDRFILGPSGDEMAWLLLGGMERGLVEIATRPEDVGEIYLSKVAEAEALDEYYIRPGQDGVLWGQDLAYNKGPFVNPETYRDLFLPGFCRRVQSAKRNGQFVIKHACGNNWPLLDMFVEAQIDCYQSIQSTAGMDIGEVQRKYGDKFSLWGGVKLENLVSGSTDDVRHDVDRVMREIAPRGGFILGTSHSVGVGTRFENFMALLEQFDKMR
jgi:hypothetical protein